MAPHSKQRAISCRMVYLDSGTPSRATLATLPRIGICYGRPSSEINSVILRVRLSVDGENGTSLQCAAYRPNAGHVLMERLLCTLHIIVLGNPFHAKDKGHSLCSL